MDIRIDDDVIEQATKCGRVFSCLSGDVENLCKVSYVLYVIGDGPCLLQCMTQPPCEYGMALGNRWMCTCPVRKEIYRQYGV
jgi:hypothetical protein